MEKIRVRVPQVVDIETAVVMYYNKLALRNDDIRALFGANICRARICKLKEMARQVMYDENMMSLDDTSVRTEAAYKAWGLDIADLERRLHKLRKIQGGRKDA